VTAFGVFLTPVFYYVLQWFGKKKADGPAGPLAAAPNGEAPVPPAATGVQGRAE
jgi:hypothetical protein